MSSQGAWSGGIDDLTHVRGELRPVERLNLRQPPNGMASDAETARHIAEQIGYPVLVRPSYVLGGRAMEIVRDDASLTPEVLVGEGHAVYRDAMPCMKALRAAMSYAEFRHRNPNPIR